MSAVLDNRPLEKRLYVLESRDGGYVDAVAVTEQQTVKLAFRFTKNINNAKAFTMREVMSGLGVAFVCGYAGLLRRVLLFLIAVSVVHADPVGYQHKTTDCSVAISYDTFVPHLRVHAGTSMVNGSYVFQLFDSLGRGGDAVTVTVSGGAIVGTPGDFAGDNVGANFGAFTYNVYANSPFGSRPAGAIINGSTGSSGAAVASQAVTVGSPICDNHGSGNAIPVYLDVTIGAPACAANVTVNMTNARGFGAATNMQVRVFIGGGGSGWMGTFWLTKAQTSSTLTIPDPLSGIVDGGNVVVQTIAGSYAYDSKDQPITFTISRPSSFNCGGAVAITLNGSSGGESTPSPSPNPTPTPSATATVSPPATATPIPTPGPIGTPTPAPGATPAPNVTVTSPGGGTASNTIVNNPNDFYAPVKKAMEDAAAGLGAPDGGNTGGAFGQANGTHDSSDFTTSRGHVDDLQGELGDIITGKEDAKGSFWDFLTNVKSEADDLKFQTFGAVTSIPINFNSVGQSPVSGKITLPTSINLVPYGDVIDLLRTCLLWLLRLGFWVETYRLLASQGGSI